MKITTIGIDLAKSVFAVHGVNEHGGAVLKKVLKRDQVAMFFANLQPCLIGMEACGRALSGWVRVPVLRTHLCIFDAKRFAKGIPQVNEVGDNHAFAFLRR